MSTVATDDLMHLALAALLLILVGAATVATASRCVVKSLFRKKFLFAGIPDELVFTISTDKRLIFECLWAHGRPFSITSSNVPDYVQKVKSGVAVPLSASDLETNSVHLNDMPSQLSHLPTQHLGGTAHLVLGFESGGREGRLGEWIEQLKIPAVDQVWLNPQETVRISIDEVRRFVRELSLAPTGSLRVGIVLQASRLTPEAGNALLKFLEEPPRQALIILEARSEDQLLSTIVSRCQRWRLAPSDRGRSRRAVVSLALMREQSLKEAFDFAKEWAESDDFVPMYDELVEELRGWVREGKLPMSVLADVFKKRALAETTVSRRLLAETVILRIRYG